MLQTFIETTFANRAAEQGVLHTHDGHTRKQHKMETHLEACVGAGNGCGLSGVACPNAACPNVAAVRLRMMQAQLEAQSQQLQAEPLVARGLSLELSEPLVARAASM